MAHPTPSFLVYITTIAALGFLSCAPDCPPEGNGVTPRFSPQIPEKSSEADTWLSYPFPSDHRRLSTGAPNYTHFPNPKDVGLLDDYLEILGSEVSGFSPTAGIYLAFDGPISEASLPALLPESRSNSSPIQLIDITPSSEEYGLRRPLRWEYSNAPSEFLPPHALAAAPSFGTPLREDTTYAYLVTSALKDDTGASVNPAPLAQLLLREDLDRKCDTESLSPSLLKDLHTDFEPLRTFLKGDPLSPEDIVAATVFTTGEFTSELQGIYEVLSSGPKPVLSGDWQTFAPDSGEPPVAGEAGEESPYLRKEFQWNSASMIAYHLFETSYTAPNFQHGSIPYNEGGGFILDDGLATVSSEESLRLVISIPELPQSGECYPTVLVGHGTGGDAYSFTNETAGRLAARGLAAVGIDQPLHGSRNGGRQFNEDLATFNFSNPTAARSTFRQGAIDTFSLAKLLSDGLVIPASVSPTGSPLCLSGESMGFFGHSQGGLSGGIAAAFETRIKSWVFSGAGGGLSTTILKRKDIVDFEQLLGFLMQFEPEEVLTPLHPLLSVIQSVVDITDPVNYAPYWHTNNRYSSPRNILLTSGELDEQTPHETAAALALAARVPQIAPASLPIIEYGMLGMLPQDSPVQGNLDGTHTSGFLQWQDSLSLPDNYSNHFLIFNRPEAIHASMRFLHSSATETAPVIERDPRANVR